jgi:hypothetical protein
MKRTTKKPTFTDTERLDYLINWLGFNEDVRQLPVRDWIDNEDARKAIDEFLSQKR